MNPHVSRYKRSVKRNLTCSSVTRRKLMKQFSLSLAKYTEEVPNPNSEMLYDAFGYPEEMAKVLMCGLPHSEYNAYVFQKRLQRILAAIALLLFIGFTAYVFFVKQSPIISYTEITEITPTEHHTPTTTGEGG